MLSTKKSFKTKKGILADKHFFICSLLLTYDQNLILKWTKVLDNEIDLSKAFSLEI